MSELSDRSAADQFTTELRLLYVTAGRPKLAAVVSRARKQQPTARLNSKTLSDWFAGKAVPKDADAVRFLIDHLGPLAEQRGDYSCHTEKWWLDLRQRAWDERHANRGGRPPIEPAGTRSEMRGPARPSSNAMVGLPTGRRDDHRDGPPHRVPDDLSVPRQLPAPAGLAGRKDELARIRSALLDSRPTNSSPRTGPRVVGIDGIPGVGKSALAVAAAHACAAVYPDGQLYVDLQGASPGMDPLAPGEVLARFLRALDVPPGRISPDTGEAAAQFRSVTATNRILIVLDNARDLAQVRPLIPAGPACAAVITSRTSMITLAASIADMLVIHLDPLDRAASAELLRRHLGERVDHEPVAAAELADLCGHLPLALRVVGARLWVDTGRALSSAVTRLRRARHRLDELGTGDLDVRSSLALSLENLRAVPDNGPQAAELLGLIGVLRTSQITLLAASALLATDEPSAQRLLELLVDHCLLTPLPGGGYHLHDLLRVFAVEQAEKHPDDSEAAIQRVVDHYIQEMCSNPDVYWPYTPLRSDPTFARPGAAADPSADTAAAWLSDHMPTLGALVEQLASRPATVRRAYELLWPIAVRLSLIHPADCIRLSQVILATATGAAEWPITVPLLLNVMNAQMYLGRFTRANQCLDRAKSYLPMIDDDRLRARMLGCEAGLRFEEDNFTGALRCATAAATLYERLGLTRALAICLTETGKALFRLGRIKDALQALERSAALEHQANDPRSPTHSAHSYYYLGIVHLRTGRPDLAKPAADISVAAIQASGDQRALGHALALRSDILRDLDCLDEAVTDAEAAVNVGRRLAASPFTSYEPVLLSALQSYSTVLWRRGDPRANAVLAEVDVVAADVRAIAAEQDPSTPVSQRWSADSACTDRGEPDQRPER